MTKQTDYLKAATEAIQESESSFGLSEASDSERSQRVYAAISGRQAESARTLALLSLAADVRRVADALERVVEQDSSKGIAAAVRILGSGS
jgi:hypothetical protein